jgi:hypothetical protein
MSFHQKVVYAFNNFYLSLLTELKKCNGESKKLVKQHFRVFDRISEEYFDNFKKNFESTDKPLDEVEVLPQTTVSKLIELVGAANTSIVRGYALILKVLVNLHSEEDETMLSHVLEIIRDIQNPNMSHNDVKENMKIILDDDITDTLTEILDALKEHPEVSAIENMFTNSKIGNLAKEISEELDPSELNLKNPEDLLNFANLSGSNNVLGNIVSKVSSKIQNKIEKGDLSQDDLIGEAMSFIGMMGKDGSKGADLSSILSNPALMDLVKNVNSSMGGSQRVAVDTNKLRTMSTKQRLQAKLEKKRREEQKNN